MISKGWYCVFCGIKFLMYSELERHILHHINEKAYSCVECGAEFPTFSRLQGHLFVHSKITTKFQCSLCQKLFKKRRYLQTHKNRVHTALRPFRVQNVKKVLNLKPNSKHTWTYIPNGRNCLVTYAGKSFPGKYHWRHTFDVTCQKTMRDFRVTSATKYFPVNPIYKFTSRFTLGKEVRSALSARKHFLLAHELLNSIWFLYTEILKHLNAVFAWSRSRPKPILIDT